MLESLTCGGVSTVLFVEPPPAELLQRYEHVQAIGIAGNSRTMSPEQMDAELPGVFQSLRSLEPQIVHYKVCSTFDSSPRVGSIGRAIDIGQSVFLNHFVPVVVGVPTLERFCVFGNLFARSGLSSELFRLDRHPTMQQHPVTPMNEADLRVHLSQQTDRPVGLVDVIALNGGPAAAATGLAEAIDGKDESIVVFDTLTDGHLATIGQLIWDAQRQESKPLFTAGSSGVEYALTAHWQWGGAPLSEVTGCDPAPAADRTLILSGSCSPVTERQIAWGLENGFVEIPFDTRAAIKSQARDAALSDVVLRTGAALDAGRSVIVHTCRGPSDARIPALRAATPPGDTTANRLGDILGRVLCEVLRTHRLQRVAVTGGDTSGYVARAVGIDALEMAAPLAPGAPLCIARSRRAEVDGLELSFKGGQVGHDDFFGTLLRGGRQA